MAKKVHIGRGCMADEDEIPDEEIERRMPLKRRLHLARIATRAPAQEPSASAEDLSAEWEALKKSLRN